MKEDILTKIPDIDYREPAISTNKEEFDKVIRSRRSVRVYTDEVVPEEVVRTAVDHALLAQGKLDEILKAKGADSEDARKNLLEEDDEAKYLAGKVSSAKFFVGSILPQAIARVKIITAGDNSALEVVL